MGQALIPRHLFTDSTASASFHPHPFAPMSAVVSYDVCEGHSLILALRSPTLPSLSAFHIQHMHLKMVTSDADKTTTVSNPTDSCFTDMSDADEFAQKSVEDLYTEDQRVERELTRQNAKMAEILRRMEHAQTDEEMDSALKDLDVEEKTNSELLDRRTAIEQASRAFIEEALAGAIKEVFPDGKHEEKVMRMGLRSRTYCNRSVREVSARLSPLTICRVEVNRPSFAMQITRYPTGLSVAPDALRLRYPRSWGAIAAEITPFCRAQFAPRLQRPKRRSPQSLCRLLRRRKKRLPGRRWSARCDRILVSRRFRKWQGSLRTSEMPSSVICDGATAGIPVVTWRRPSGRRRIFYNGMNPIPAFWVRICVPAPRTRAARGLTVPLF